MKKTFKVTFIDGYPAIKDNENTIVVDTCSPVTFHNKSVLKFLEEEYVTSESFQDESLNKLRDYTNRNFTTWLGLDVISNYKLLLDYGKGEITFLSHDEPKLKGTSVKLHTAGKVYAIQVNGFMYMLVDSRSPISYILRCYTKGLDTDGQRNEFFHGVGSFETPVYNLDCEFRKRNVIIPFGNFPENLDTTLLLAHIEGSLGYDFFKNFRILFDFKEKKATYLKDDLNIGTEEPQGPYQYDSETSEVTVFCETDEKVYKYFEETACKSVVFNNTVGGGNLNIETINLQKCPNLASVYIGSKVRSVKPFSFVGAKSLSSIKVSPENKTYDSRNDCNAIISTKGKVLVAGCKATIFPEGVKKIGTAAFFTHDIESVVIPEGVTDIESYAFAHCSSLKYVYIPASIKYIPFSAFYCCPALETIEFAPNAPKYFHDNLSRYKSSAKGKHDWGNVVSSEYLKSGVLDIIVPEGVTGFGGVFRESSIRSIRIPESVTKILGRAFEECHFLETVVFPKSLEKLGAEAFWDCYWLRSVHLHENIKEIGTYTFRSCRSLTSAILEGVTKIGDDAFDGCERLNTILFPDSLKEIGRGAFSGCKSLKEILIPDNIERLEASAFYLCTSLKSITIPKTITEIKDYTFAYCRSLQKISLPDSITSIGNSAFEQCEKLENIEIGCNVIHIGELTFRDCCSLERIIVHHDNKIYDSRENCNAIIETGTYTLLFGCKNTVIPYGIRKIADWAFAGCETLESIVIPKGLTNIGNYAFKNCRKLRTVEISSGLQVLGNSAFEGCEELVKVVLPKGVKRIMRDTFSGCQHLKSVEMPEGLERIEDYAFDCCYSLKSIVIPESVKFISEKAFRFCRDLNAFKATDEVIINCFSEPAQYNKELPEGLRKKIKLAYDNWRKRLRP